MNLENMIVDSNLSTSKNKIKKIFFYRICGTGMGACACLAKEAGFEVAGADMTFSPPMSTYLESLDIPLMKLSDVTKEELQNYDLIIVGNSVPRNSDYAKFVEESGVPFTSFPSFLGEFVLKEKTVIGIAGTHGKTTTTHFLTQMLEFLGEDAGYFVGGIIEGRAPSKLGGKYFVIESDEYDSAYFQKISKFRLYELNHMILTSLEFDHADIFNSIEDIKNEFSATLNGFAGNIIANDAYQAIDELEEKFKDLNWKKYGEASDNGPLNIEVLNGKTKFFVMINGERVAFETNIIGTHNILNITSSILMCSELGFEIQDIIKSVSSLGMVKRRQENRGTYKESIVIDDFAHHPKAIALTIDAIKESYPGKKIITVFEPVSATARSSIFQKEFAASFKKSDEVIIAVNPLQTTVKDSKNLDADRLVSDISSFGISAISVNSLDHLISFLDSKAAQDNLFLILSNRTCIGLWESDFVKNLS